MRKLMIAGLAVASVLALAVGAYAAQWRVPYDFPTIQDAIDSPDVMSGDTIVVAPGEWAGANVNKSVKIVGEGGATISTGPTHSIFVAGFRLLDGSAGTTISHLTFVGVDLPVYNAAGRTQPGNPDVQANNVTITHCTFYGALQAVSNWGGSGWSITHNKIINLRTHSGGGIGILIADFLGRTLEGNVVAHNTIEGTVNVWGDDCGGYTAPGIALCADYRWGRSGAVIRNNRVFSNKVALTSSNPDPENGVPAWAFEMSILTTDDDTPQDGSVIYQNAIGFNDFRGSDNQISLVPEELADYNVISRNLGENRGHGSHPSEFKPL